MRGSFGLLLTLLLIWISAITEIACSSSSKDIARKPSEFEFAFKGLALVYGDTNGMDYMDLRHTLSANRRSLHISSLSADREECSDYLKNLHELSGRFPRSSLHNEQAEEVIDSNSRVSLEYVSDDRIAISTRNAFVCIIRNSQLIYPANFFPEYQPAAAPNPPEPQLQEDVNAGPQFQNAENVNPQQQPVGLPALLNEEDLEYDPFQEVAEPLPHPQNEDEHSDSDTEIEGEGQGENENEHGFELDEDGFPIIPDNFWNQQGQWANLPPPPPMNDPFEAYMNNLMNMKIALSADQQSSEVMVQEDDVIVILMKSMISDALNIFNLSPVPFAYNLISELQENANLEVLKRRFGYSGYIAASVKVGPFASRTSLSSTELAKNAERSAELQIVSVVSQFSELTSEKSRNSLEVPTGVEGMMPMALVLTGEKVKRSLEFEDISMDSSSESQAKKFKSNHMEEDEDENSEKLKQEDENEDDQHIDIEGSQGQPSQGSNPNSDIEDDDYLSEIFGDPVVSSSSLEEFSRSPEAKGKAKVEPSLHEKVPTPVLPPVKAFDKCVHAQLWVPEGFEVMIISKGLQGKKDVVLQSHHTASSEVISITVCRKDVIAFYPKTFENAWSLPDYFAHINDEEDFVDYATNFISTKKTANPITFAFIEYPIENQ